MFLGVRIRNRYDVSEPITLPGGAQIFPDSCGEAIGSAVSTSMLGCSRPISFSGSSVVMIYSFATNSFSIPLGASFNWSVSENPLP
jgi:hypothetical protein